MDSITTLIVEDEPMLAEILVDTIKIFPQFSIVGIADKLESAKKQIRLYQPQLILLDNFLPDGKGIDLIRHTISTNYTGRIIFITADNHMDTISDALRMGVFDYLIKPVHYQRLQHTLERFTRYRSSLRPVSRQTRRTLMPYLISRPKNKPQNRIADCGELMKTPSTGYDKYSPTRRQYIQQTLWRKFWAAVKPLPDAIWNKA